MADADTWVTILLVDSTDTHVLAESVVGLRRQGENYVIAEPPVELAVTQDGRAGFVVLQNLAGKEVLRVEYSGRTKKVNKGDAVRINNISVPV